jgi:hypothetical protein
MTKKEVNKIWVKIKTATFVAVFLCNKGILI